MSSYNQNIIPSINKYNKYSGKENNHSLSPNIRPVHSSNKQRNNNLFPKNQMIFKANQNINIKINKIPQKKEKIIEGDLIFNEKSKQIHLKKIPNQNYPNNKQRKRGMPTKSPLPIANSFRPKDILSFNRIFSSNARYLRQKEQKKFNKTTKLFRPAPGNQNFKNNYIFGGNLNANMSKSFNNLHDKNDRSHSPILRVGNNKLLNIGVKVPKNRILSKSPNLGKSSMFNGNGHFSISFLNQGNGKKRIIKKIPNSNNNSNNFKKINNIIPSQKKNTIISGEIYQEPFKMNKNNNNNINMNKGVNIVNIRPVSSNHTINANVNSNNTNTSNLHYNNSSNSMNVLRNDNSDIFSKKNVIDMNNTNNKNNINNNNKIRNIERPKSPKRNPDYNRHPINNKPEKIDNNNNEIDIYEMHDISKKPNTSNINNNNNNNINNNMTNNINSNSNNNSDSNKKINKPPNVEVQNSKLEQTKQEKENKPEESKVNNEERSQSQPPINPINKKNILEESAKKEMENNIIEENKTNNKIIKKIKDIYPYTHVGFDGEQPKENNQDNYFIFKNFADNNDYIYMSVCDGHGVEGHFVSEFIKEILPYYMSENLKHNNILTEKEITHKIITETFLIVNNMLVTNENINSLFSGSTCVSVIFTPERLIVPNIGDSRAVLARYDKETGKYKAIELSRDHKPTEKDEAQRIYENDGRIQPFTEDGEFVGPQRVWVKDEELPGLAMTRSFGDRVAATVGVMSEPEIKEFDFNENDKYMIIASDGIWEFISSQECVDMVQQFYENNDAKGCCEYLYQESSQRWLKEEEVIDDTTLILVFFE